MRLNGKEGDGGNGFSPETEHIDKSQIWRRARAQWQIHENSPTILLNITSHLNIPMSGWMLSQNRGFKNSRSSKSCAIQAAKSNTHSRIVTEKSLLFVRTKQNRKSYWIPTPASKFEENMQFSYGAVCTKHYVSGGIELQFFFSFSFFLYYCQRRNILSSHWKRCFFLLFSVFSLCTSRISLEANGTLDFELVVEFRFCSIFRDE